MKLGDGPEAGDAAEAGVGAVLPACLLELGMELGY